MFQDYGKTLLNAILQGARGKAQAEYDLSALPNRDAEFDESAFGQMMPNDMTADTPGLWNVPDYSTQQRGAVGIQSPSLAPAGSPWVAPRGATPEQTAADHANSAQTWADINRGSQAMQAGLQDNIARDTQQRIDRNIGQGLSPNSEWLASQGGGFSPSGRGPGGGAVERDFMSPAKPIGGHEDLAPGQTGAYRDLLGQIKLGVNDRGAPNPNKYTEADDGLPGGSEAFGKVLPTRNSLSQSMDRYSQAMQAQRAALAARGKAPDEIAHIMGGPRPGPDLSVLRAVNGANMDAGLNPRLSASLALDAAGGPADGGTTAALRDLILGGNQQTVDPLRTAQAGLVGVQQKVEEQKLKDMQDPAGALSREIKATNAGDEQRVRGLAGNNTVVAINEPRVQTLYGNDYANSGTLHPDLERVLQQPITNDEYDNANGHIGNLWGILGRGGFTTSTDEQVYVDHIARMYPGVPEAAVRKFYREKSGRLGPTGKFNDY